jgi:ribosomal protein S13
MQNTNVNGKHKVAFALRIIKGLGRRFANLTCKIAQIDLNKRAGELTQEQMAKIDDIITKPIGKPFLKFIAFCRVRCSQVVPQQTALH